jgi:signal peptidase I
MVFMILKFYVIDIIKVNSPDMNNSLFYGDLLLIKRAFNNYQTNDIIYFKFPVKDTLRGRTYAFQRLIGLPGDTVEVRDKKVWLNNFCIQDTSTLKFNFYIKTVDQYLDTAFKVRYHLQEGGKISQEFDYSFSLTKAQADSLKYLSLVQRVQIKSEQKGSFDQTVFPYSTRYSWNLDNFGKLYLPKKGDTLLLDTLNLNIYGIILREYERNLVEIRNDSLLINNEYTNKYCVKKNYYFVMGDNRDNANDSRVFGFLPESFIRGKVIKVLKKKEQ